MTDMRTRFARVPMWARVVIGVVLAVVVANLAARALDQSVGGSAPGGAPASSYATASNGLAAYAELLARAGHPVTRHRGALADGDVPTTSTLMILDPDFLTPNDAGVALQFVVNGGRLVIGGNDPNRYLRMLRDRPPTWSATVGTSEYTDTTAPFEDIREVTTNANGAWTKMGTSLPLVGTTTDALLTQEQVGQGQMLFIADVSPLSNELLATSDNAGFGVLLAGDDGRPVVFDEGVHGYGQSRGIAAIPTRWKYALGVLALAALVLLWARARRLGPPEDAARELPPPRREYVDALAATLQRTGEPARAIDPVRATIRREVAARAGLPADASDADFVRAATSVGLDEHDAQVVVRGTTNDDEVVAVGRALARLERWDNGRDE
jgi:hypothetical protein